jgi:cell division protein FtsI/penicillin-binding protein 2
MLALFAVLLIGQAARVQLVHGKEWAEKARRQQFKDHQVEAARGNIFDAAGNLLVESREMFKVNIAPNEIKNPTAVVAELRKLDVGNDIIREALDKRRKWLTLPDMYVAGDIAVLVAQAGIHADAVMSREYATAPGIRRIVGGLDPQGRPNGGVELGLERVISGG